MTLIIGLLIGYFFWKLFAGKHEGDKIERSFRFLIRGYYIHIHHWIWCTLLLMYFFITSYQNALVRLSKNSYKTKSLKTYDEKLVQRILADIKNIEFISQIRLNKKGVIVEAPKS